MERGFGGGDVGCEWGAGGVSEETGPQHALRSLAQLTHYHKKIKIKEYAFGRGLRKPPIGWF